jgi:Spy/CpxP family protein refolding chaperone
MSLMAANALAQLDGPPPVNDPGRHGSSISAGMQYALNHLQLTDDQQQKVDPFVQQFRQQQEQARNDFMANMKLVLTPEQYDQFEADLNRPARPASPGQTPRTETNSADPVPADLPMGSVIFSGGYETDPRDRGRPVVLVAAGLNVSPDVFRKAFSKVKPAGPGEQPDPAQVRLNKQTLLNDLGPLGVTDDLLNTVSNYYRYSRTRGEMWRTSPASATAVVKDGVVTSITITNPGSGYSSVPAVTVKGAESQHFTTKLLFSTDLTKNGSIAKITIDPPATPATP